MSKRKLTRRQAWRMSKVQEDRRNRARKQSSQVEKLLASDQLGPEQMGLLIARFGPSVEVEGADHNIYTCYLRQNIDDPVAGDNVVWRQGHDQSGVVTAVMPRQTSLSRPDRTGKPKPLAANISRMAIVIAPQPLPTQELIDRYLACAELLNLNPFIVFNKIELSDYDDEHIQVLFELFKQIGYEVIEASAHLSHGMEELQQALINNTSIFVGQSGVGKSSLISNLLPQESIRVGGLSEKTGVGKHTTSTTRLYHLPQGGKLIDSPGVRNFKLWDVSPLELLQGFREFKPLIGQCKFRDCHHINEPGCTFQQAIKDGKILKLRLDSYMNILKSMR